MMKHKTSRVHSKQVNSTVPPADHDGHKQQLWTKNQKQNYEDQTVFISPSISTILSLLDLDSYRKLSNAPLGTDPEEIIDNLLQRGYIKQSGKEFDIPLFSAYLLAHDLRDFHLLKHRYIRLIKYSGKNNLSSADIDKDIYGGTAVSFEQTFRKILELIPKKEVIDLSSGRRITRYALPPLAVKEVLINAISHQDFSIRGTRIFVEIFSDRLEISNPGTPLVPPLSFLGARTVSRNERLANEMRLLGLSGNQGRGWDKIVNSIEEAKLPAPEIQIKINSTSVIMWFSKPLNLLTLEEKNWTVYLHTVRKYLLSEPANNASLRERLNLPESESSTVSKLFRQAIEAGLILPLDNSSSNKLKEYVPAWSKED